MMVLNWGEQQVDAGTAALVVNIGPPLTALLGARLLAGRPAAGAGGRDGGVLRRAVTVGLSMSGGVVAQKPALGHASALQVTASGCAVGAVLCLPFAGQPVREAADAPLSATLDMV